MKILAPLLLALALQPLYTQACFAPPLPALPGSYNPSTDANEIMLMSNPVQVPMEKRGNYFKVLTLDGGPGSCGSMAFYIRKDAAAGVGAILGAGATLLLVLRFRRK